MYVHYKRSKSNTINVDLMGGKEAEEEERDRFFFLGRRYVLVNVISPSPEAACESQSKGLSDCTLHAN